MQTFHLGVTETDALIRGLDLLIAQLEQAEDDGLCRSDQIAQAESLRSQLETVERELCGLAPVG